MIVKDKITWWKLLIVFISAIVLEANSIASFTFLMEKNWYGMVGMVFINPFLCLPMNHFTIEVKTFYGRFLIALAFALGFSLGVLTIRPYFIQQDMTNKQEKIIVEVSSIICAINIILAIVLIIKSIVL